MDKLEKIANLEGEEKNTVKLMMDFVNKLLTLEPAEVCGVARILGVALFKDGKILAEEATINCSTPEEQQEYLKNNCMRDTESIISDMIDAYCNLNRQRRRNLMKILRKVK